jgi:ubiquinone/menaquinone biosynthesis C-methylase UbiE
MKARESGMPDAHTWAGFFDADGMISALGCVERGDENIVEFGCGYGTFTLAVARRTTGVVQALDIDSDMVSLVQRKAHDAGLTNIHAQQRDFIENGTGLADASTDHAMIWNLLHLEYPVALLEHAHRVLKPGGSLSVVHWKLDPETPRGPSMHIRPRPEQCRAWAHTAGFQFLRDADLSASAPHHYGLLFARGDVRA